MSTVNKLHYRVLEPRLFNGLAYMSDNVSVRAVTSNKKNPQPSWCINFMFERFTEGAIKVIMLAQEESRRLGHNFVGTEQILVGLIAQGKGIAARSLRAAGVNLKDALVAVEQRIGRGSGFVAVEIPFTPRAKRVLELAWQESKRLGHSYIGTEHLLLGLLYEGGGVAIEVLEKLDVDLEQLRTQVDAAARLKRYGMPTEPMVPESTSEHSSLEAFNWYDDLAALSVGQAWVIAETFGVSEIEPEHLFLGVIRDSGTILGALTNSRVSFSELRRQVIQSIQFGDNLIFPQALPFSERSKKVLASAWSLAVGHKRFVSKECIFLALLKDPESTVSQVLKTLGVDVAALCQSVEAEIQPKS